MRPGTLRPLVDVSAVPARPAGAGTYVLRLVEALGRRDDVELALVAGKDDEDRWRALAPEAEVAAWVPTNRPLRLLWEQVKGPATARHLRGQLWHGPHYTLPLRPGMPAVVTVHDLTFFDHPEWHEASKVRYFRRMIRWSVRRAAAVVCVSDTTAVRLHELLRPTAPVVVAPHGVDLHRFRPASDPAVDEAGDDALLASFGIRPPFVAFVGTVEPRKNLAGLVRAMERLPAETSLVLAGQDGWGTEPVYEAIERSTRNVIRLGYVDEAVVPALYRRAGAVAYPALAEGFGLPTLEALACGARVVTSAGTVMEDVAGRAAVLVPPGDDDALADGLALALLGGGPDPALGPAVAARHSWAASADRHVEAYRIALDT
jgi:glycosyltransferase involved in cell wall biosynthesis